MVAPPGGGRQGVQTPGVQTPGVMVRIDDPGDPRLGDYLELTDPGARRRRERDELFIAEGPSAIVRLLASGHPVRSVLVTPEALVRFDGALDVIAAPVYVAPRAVLAATVGFDLHRGAVAAADRRPLPALGDVVAGATTLAVLEGLNDPENLGRRRPLGAGVRDRRARARPDVHRPVLPAHGAGEHG
jgi:hypothetical protein